MRTVRWLASGLALIALLPSASAAQQGRLFRDSWFWGANAGVMNFSTATVVEPAGAGREPRMVHHADPGRSLPLRRSRLLHGERRREGQSRAPSTTSRSRT